MTSEKPPGILRQGQFLLVMAATLLYFMANAATAPVLPRFVRFELDHSTVMVGLVAGAAAVGALATRPFLARTAARRGTKLLVVAGGLMGAVGLVGHDFATTVAPLFPLRVLMGMGQAAFLVGSLALGLELAPPERRGAAMSLVLVGAQIGLAIGPLVGEAVLDAGGYRPVWVTAATMMLASVATASLVKGIPVSTDEAPSTRSLHRSGVGPGVVLGVGQLGFIGFNTFVPLYGRELGLSGVAPVFFLMSAVVTLMRFGGAGLPDRLGSTTVATFALCATALGLVVTGAWAEPIGLYAGATGIGIGSAFLFPSLAAAATVGVTERDRAAAIATFTMFLDVCIGIAPALNGATAAIASYRVMFLISALYSMTALAILHLWVAPELRHGARTRAAQLEPLNAAPSE